MPKFGRRSHQCIEELTRPLQAILISSIQVVDFSVLVGHRDRETQNQAFSEGRSKVVWPLSKHNQIPSEAFDVAPYPIDWDDRERFFYLAGVIMARAETHGVRLRWGGAWLGDFNGVDGFDDLGHFERVD